MIEAPSTAECIEHIFGNFDAFREVAAANPESVAIPSCPDWDMAALLKHMCDVAAFWNAVIDAQGEVPGPSEPAQQVVEGFELFDTAIAGLKHRFASLPGSTPIWTWLGSRTLVPWLTRRLVAETSLHLWDAQGATPSGPNPVDPVFAADGIDEYFETISFTAAPAASVHMHASDIDGEWSIAAGEDGARVVTHDHTKADVAVRGSASDLLLLLWGRCDLGTLEVFGDASVVTDWLKPV